MATLALYLPESWVSAAADGAARDAATQWYLLGSAGQIERRSVGLPDSTTLTEQVDRVVAILPAECATLLEAVLPAGQRRRMLDAIPYVLEDELASPIEDLHFAVGAATPSGGYRVAVIEKALLRRVLAHLGEAGLAPAVVCLDSLLVPAAADETTLLEVAGRVLLNAGGEQALAVAPEDVAVALASASASALAAGVVRRVRVAHGGETAAFWQQVIAASGVGSAEIEACADPVAVLLAQLDQPGLVNLLSGEFAPVRRDRRRSLVAAAIAAAAVIGVLQIGYFAVAGWYFNRAAEGEQRRAEAMYRDIFPGDRNIVNLRAQAEGRLKATAGEQGRHLIAQLQAFGPVWRTAATPASVIHSLRYDRGDDALHIDISADSVQSVERLAAALRARALTAKLLSAQEDGTGVRAKLVVGGGDGGDDG